MKISILSGLLNSYRGLYFKVSLNILVFNPGDSVIEDIYLTLKFKKDELRKIKSLTEDPEISKLNPRVRIPLEMISTNIKNYIES